MRATAAITTMSMGNMVITITTLTKCLLPGA